MAPKLSIEYAVAYFVMEFHLPWAIWCLRMSPVPGVCIREMQTTVTLHHTELHRTGM
jgi:hypothetical protein